MSGAALSQTLRATGIGLALTLLALSLPHFAARLVMLPGDPTRDALLLGQPVEEGAFKTLIASREKSLSLAALPDAQRDLALAHFTQNNLDQAFAAQTAALSQSPADAYGWARYASLAPAKETKLQALKRSFLSAPHEPRLAATRLHYLVTFWDDLPPALRAQLTPLIFQAARTDIKTLAAQAHQATYTTLIRSALQDDKELLQSFDEAARIE